MTLNKKMPQIKSRDSQIIQIEPIIITFKMLNSISGSLILIKKGGNFFIKKIKDLIT